MTNLDWICIKEKEVACNILTRVAGWVRLRGSCGGQLSITHVCGLSGKLVTFQWTESDRMQFWFVPLKVWRATNCNMYCLPDEGAMPFAYQKRCNAFCLPKKVQCLLLFKKVQCLLLTEEDAIRFAYRRRCKKFCLPKKVQYVLLTEEGAISFAYRRRCNTFCLPKKVQ